VIAEVSVGGDDDDEEREHSEQIDLSGIVTVVADFPAHCLRPPCGSIKSMRRLGCGSRATLPARLQCAFGLKAVQQVCGHDPEKWEPVLGLDHA
jgi:hypothetical protein